MLANMTKLKNGSSHIWMLTGTGNNERFIGITKIHEELGELLTKSLRAFADLGNANLTEELLQSLFDIIQKFTCHMYGAKKSVDVDDGRYQLFVSIYEATDVNENFWKKVRSFDASSIPPCKSELYQQFLRAHYISSIWRNASQKQPTTFNPLEYGWVEHESSFMFKWFEGDQLSCLVSDLIDDSPETDGASDDILSHDEDDDSEDDTEV
ncbi:hypothetical protein NQ318_004097 [Aromia moschata]|uniref:Uncharacterized protein n=1 Tax=Aromia moschata TaxID=1265417 RepID=A0AAV8XSM6_9CUCU|nr:hypothetical protein NQ318_004097 [Aromia moschata]